MKLQTPLIAYHGKDEIKEKYLTRVRLHREADELIQGAGWQNGKGCAVGCTLEAYDHSLYPKELGIPEILARLEDVIFEGLTPQKAMLWPERFLNAVKVGVDLTSVAPKFLLAIVRWRFEAIDGQGKKLVGSAIEQVISVLEKWVKTGTVDKSAAWSAARAAWNAAKNAAESAAESAAWSAESAAKAAWSAARAAERSVWSAERAESAERSAWNAASAAWSAAKAAERSVWSAERAESAERSAERSVWSAESAARAAWNAARAAERSAWSAEYEWMAETLIQLIQETK